MRSLGSLALIATFVALVASPLFAQHEKEDEAALLKRWNDFEIQLRQVERNLAELQSAYNGADTEGRARIKKQYEGLSQSTVERAKKLVDEGVPVAPLPFMPTRKTN